MRSSQGRANLRKEEKGRYENSMEPELHKYKEK